MTPVQAAKMLGIRPQIVYGFIRSTRIGTYSNPAGKTALVDLDEVARVAGGVRHHREKDPATGKPVRKAPPVSRGSVVSYHGYIKGIRKQREKPHKVAVVTEVVNNDDGQPTLIATRRGESATMYWEAEALAERIAKGACHIESAETLLGVIMYSWTHTEKIELAASLQLWAEANKVDVPVIEEKEAEQDAEPTEPEPEPEPEYNTPE